VKSLATWRQVRSAPGALGASLIAQPSKRTFYTLSAWADRDALYAYARTEPHRGIMTSLRSTMRSSAFTFWEAPAEQLPITWEEAHRRLADQARAGATSSPEQT
jgi:quinol monooxygenase YgiN